MLTTPPAAYKENAIDITYGLFLFRHEDQELPEWWKDSGGLEFAGEKGGEMSKITGEPMIQNHSEAVGYFNLLLIDLKLQNLGEEYEPITMERLEEGTRHIRDIAECQRIARIRY